MIARGLTHFVSRLAAVLAVIPAPPPVNMVIWWIVARIYGARLDETERPFWQYLYFQQFFTRRLRPGVRPQPARDDVAASPVDALWLAHQKIDGPTFMPVKGNPHSVAEMLDQDEDWDGGTASTFYLRPGDYHRIHAHCDFVVDGIRHIPGTLFPVNSLGQKVPGLFCRNERVVIRGHNGQTELAVILVGALMVGSMSLTHPALQGTGTGGAIRRGDEIGMFKFGSTVILLSRDWHPADWTKPTEIRVGTPIWQQSGATTPAKGAAADHDQ